METLKEVKCAQIDLLNELKRICEKNNITYFLIGGTLIGAIRHNGFIPWDDDIDIGMLRDQYDKFIEACKTDLDIEYELYDWYRDEASPLPFLKLKIKGTHYPEQLSKKAEMNNAIYIDIFPYDNAPDSKMLQRIQAQKIYFIRKILLLRCGFAIDDTSYLKRGLYGILRFFSCYKSVMSWKMKCDSILKQYNICETAYVGNMCGSYSYFKELKQRDLLKNTEPHKFENFEFPVPVKYDQYLKEVYGDYMKLPPASEQIGRHGVTDIDFGSYRVRYKGE